MANAPMRKEGSQNVIIKFFATIENSSLKLLSKQKKKQFKSFKIVVCVIKYGNRTAVSYDGKRQQQFYAKLPLASGSH